MREDTGLLSEEARTAIAAIRSPRGHPVLVRTVASIPASTIGSFASNLMSQETHWQRLRPRGFLRTHFRQDPAWAPGVYVLVSRRPELVQIRFGPEIRLAAYQDGLAAGDWYRRQQRLHGGDVGGHLEGMLRDLAEKMHSIAEPPWPLSWARAMSSWVGSEVLDTLLLPRIRSALPRFVPWALGSLGLLGTLLTGFAALGLLSHGRLEDELALEALGLSFLSRASFGPAMVSTGGGWWLAIARALVALLGDIGVVVQEAAAAARQAETRLGLPVRC